MTQKWACLMYHSIPGAGQETDYFGVRREAFAEQLACLVGRGLVPMSLEDSLLRGGPKCALTFDDAHESVYREALPELVRVAGRGTVFVVSSWVGRSGYCSWPQLRELRAHGWSIQSHTHSHPFLSTMSRAAASDELRVSRELIEDQIGAPVTTLSLPNGDAPRQWRIDDYRALGFDVVATSRWGPASSRLARGFVSRYTIRRATTLSTFRGIVVRTPGLNSLEGLKLGTASLLRDAMGVERYARLRKAGLGLFRLR